VSSVAILFIPPKKKPITQGAKLFSKKFHALQAIGLFIGCRSSPRILWWGIKNYLQIIIYFLGIPCQSIFKKIFVLSKWKYLFR
jgi:hypothetical protein